MKKIALYFLAAAAVFAGCSKNNVETTPVADEDAWMYDATLPVPIRLGASTNTLTKGNPIETLEQMDGKLFGFYAINSGKDSLEGAWSTNVPNMPLSLKFDGVQGHYNAATRRFDFVGGPYYYDQTDWTPYTFYGYYAHVKDVTNPDYVETQEGVIATEKIFVRLGIGHNDILWGKAEADSVKTTSGETCWGFNAPYLRNGGNQPVMTFKHMTSCVSFKVQQVGTDAITMNIDSVVVENAPKRANLVIASKNASEEGKFASVLGDRGPIYLGGMPQKITTVSKDLGNESLFLYPQQSYEVRIDYSYGNSKDSYTAKLEPKTKFIMKDGTVKDSLAFIAGYHYKYNFKIYSPEEIVVEAEIEPYKPAFGTDADGNDIVQDYDPEEYMGSH